MEMPQLGKSVRKVVLLQSGENGKLTPTVIFKSSPKKRKVSRSLKPLEKGARNLAKAQVAYADTYFDKHNRSNQKRRDGWLRDFVYNIADAGRDARKKLRLG